MNIERLSLDQLRVFALVAETGSFSGAAKKLNRAQSAISYAITTLEQQLGVEVFDRSGYRPQLTVPGRVLLDDVRVILARTDSLHARALSFSTGLEPELTLSVEALFPVAVLAAALRDFRARFPTVNVRVFSETLGMVGLQVQGGTAHLGILELMFTPTGLTTIALPHIVLVPVAAPSHPLARRDGVIPAAQLQEHVQLVVTDRSQVTAGQDFNVFSPNAWRLSDIGTKHQLLLAGMGFGTMPLHMVRADLAAGRLKQLRLEPHPPEGDRLPFGVAFRADAPLGPAAQWLVERLKSIESLESLDQGTPASDGFT